nr:putative RNA-dependent RNA polymerase [Cordyceps militaris partitivirus 1]
MSFLTPPSDLIDTSEFLFHETSILGTDLVPEDPLETDLPDHERFEFYTHRQDPLPDNRIPLPGIQALAHIQYHNTSSDARYIKQPDTGPPPMRGVKNIIADSFPQFLPLLDEWCRPKSSDNAIFSDFNHRQAPVSPLNKSRTTEIMSLLDHFLGIEPYDIVHFCDTRFYPWDLSKKADYFHNHSRARKRHAAESHPSYATGPTKKSWFINAHLFHDRSTVHNIKLHGLPFKPTNDESRNIALLQLWYQKIPTELLVRSHISHPSKLKVRPVYNAPMIYLRIECMLFYPLLAQARKKTCSIMYGLETIRGGMSKIEEWASTHSMYCMIDWSKFDHNAPYVLVDLFFEWIKTKILVDQGYAKISNYQEHSHSFAAQAKKYGIDAKLYPEGHTPEMEQFAQKVENLIGFLKDWYKNMVYITPDGFAYRRQFAGVPSGILMTQFIDSFVNLAILLDGFLEFGLTSEEIRTIIILLMGDDNVFLTPETLSRLRTFLEWFAEYALKRWHMEVNVEKSAFTTLRRKIEVLGYTNNYGMPFRSTSKLIGQLAYPERHVTDEDMCMRAIGFAWCSAGADATFHALCKKVFHHYYAKINTPIEDIIEHGKHGLPGMFFAYKDVISHIKLDHFPTIFEVRETVSFHHGFLTEEPLWNYHYFLSPPNPKRPGMTTLAEFRTK